MKTVNGVITTSSTVLSNTCAFASSVPLPGGMFGPSTQMTSGRTTSVPTIVSSATRPPCVDSRPGGRGSDDIHESVHVADRLHRAAEPVDEAGGAGNEALPAVVALLAGTEREGDGRVGVRRAARRVVALVLRVVRDAHERHDHVERRNRECVRRVVRVDPAHR